MSSDLLAEYVYAKELQWDGRFRDGGRDQLRRDMVTLRKQAVADGRDPDEIIPMYRYEDLPKWGLSLPQLAVSQEHLTDDLKDMREALAQSNIGAVEHHVTEALGVFGITLDDSSQAYLAVNSLAIMTP